MAMCFALSRTRVRTRTNERTGVHEGGTRAVRPFERLTRPSKTASTISVDHPTYSRSNSISRSFFGTFHIFLNTLVNVVLGHRDWEFSRILIFRRPIFLSRSLRSGSGTYFTLSRNVPYELTLGRGWIIRCYERRMYGRVVGIFESLGNICQFFNFIIQVCN